MPKAGYVPWYEVVMTQLTALVASAVEIIKAPHIASEETLNGHLSQVEFARRVLEQASLPEYHEGRIVIELCKRLDELAARIVANEPPKAALLRKELEEISASLCQKYEREAEQYRKGLQHTSSAH